MQNHRNLFINSALMLCENFICYWIHLCNIPINYSLNLAIANIFVETQVLEVDQHKMKKICEKILLM